MFVNIAPKKEICPAVTLTYDGESYNMENLNDKLLERLYAGGVFDASLYLFTADLAVKNGYGHYVDKLHDCAVTSYQYAPFGVIALCSLDLFTLAEPFYDLIENALSALDYSTVEANKTTEFFDCSYDEICREKRELDRLRREADEFERVFERAAAVIREDIEDEKEAVKAFTAVASKSAAEKAKRYIDDKERYVKDRYKRARDITDDFIQRLDTGAAYYEDYIKNFQKISARRLTDFVFGCCYDDTFAEANERKTSRQSGIDRFAAQLAEHADAKRVDAILERLNEPFRAAYSPVSPRKSPERVNKLFRASMVGNVLEFSAAGYKSAVANIVVSPEGKPVTWSAQSGKWGQWAYTYCPVTRQMSKWEAAGDVNAFKSRRVAHFIIQEDVKFFSVTPEYLIAQLYTQELILFYNDGRFAAADNEICLPEFFGFSYEFYPRKWVQELKKWSKS